MAFVASGAKYRFLRNDSIISISVDLTLTIQLLHVISLPSLALMANSMVSSSYRQKCFQFLLFVEVLRQKDWTLRGIYLFYPYF